MEWTTKLVEAHVLQTKLPMMDVSEAFIKAVSAEHRGVIDRWADEQGLEVTRQSEIQQVIGTGELVVVTTCQVVVGRRQQGGYEPDGEWTWSARWEHWASWFHSMRAAAQAREADYPDVDAIDGDAMARGNVWQAVRAFDKAHRISAAGMVGEDGAYAARVPSEQVYDFCAMPETLPTTFDLGFDPNTGQPASSAGRVIRPGPTGLFTDVHDAVWTDDDDFGVTGP